MHTSDLWRKTQHPLIMGILNVTPDSFSDGGSYTTREKALAHAFEMIDQGADIIDIGGESTRPGSDPVTLETEIERVISIVKELAPSIDVPISVDTTKSKVAELSLDAGASIINDICGFKDESMIDVAIEYQCPAIIMHMHGRPKTLKTDVMNGDFMTEIKEFLDERTERLLEAGAKRENIILDPGVGFGKTADQNMKIVRNSGWFSDDLPTLIGPSRKRFLAECFPNMDADEATSIVSKIATDSGARMIRVHNVEMVKTTLTRSN